MQTEEAKTQPSHPPGTPASLRILYVGEPRGTSLNRAKALERDGHALRIVDPFEALPRQGLAATLWSKALYEVGGELFDSHVRRKLLAQLEGKHFDLVWVNGGELLGPATIRALRAFAPKVVNYNNDDPFGARDKRRFSLYQRAVPEYDLLAVLRDSNLAEARAAGARQVMRVPFSASDEDQRAQPLTEDERAQWASEVVFVGSWMPERGPFLDQLLRRGVPLTIRGGSWHKAREWPSLQQAWAGPNLGGVDYVKAIQSAKICLGLLSKGNRDLSTRRSAEVPYAGTLLCAERTPEHEALFVDGEEAVFWSSARECAEKCAWLLARDDERERIARAGQRRCIRNGMLDSVVIRNILAALLDEGGPGRSVDSGAGDP